MKHLVSSRLVSSRLVSSSCLLTALSFTNFVAAQSYHSADLNLDGRVDVSDVQCSLLLVLAYTSKVDPTPPCVQVPPQTADINCDESLSIADLLLTQAIAINDTAAIQSIHDKDFFSGWAFLRYTCQRDVRRGEHDWQCPYTFASHSQVECAGRTTCSLDQDGRTWCWGSDDVGALGNFKVSGSANEPELSIRHASYSKISGAGTSAGSLDDDAYCGISRIDDTLWCWGESSTKRVGVGQSATTYPGPRRIGTSADQWSDVAVGREHVCAIKNTSPPTLWCWGSNDNGQLALGSIGGGPFAPQLVPNPTSGTADWASIYAGNDVTCAILTDDTGWCWGRNNVGQVGNGDKGVSQVHTPTQILGSYSWSVLSTYAQTTCGVTTAGQAYCWGASELSGNPTGQLGVGTPPSCSGRTTPTCCVPTGCWAIPLAVDAGVTYSHISVGGFHVCGITSSPTVRLKCWGDNSSGQLGLGTFGGIQSTPQEVGSSSTWTSVAAGEKHTCALRPNGSGPDTQLFCWGKGSDGQIGHGFNISEESPAPVLSFAQPCSCGDGFCDGYESSLICYPDCGSCGDGVCTPAHEDPVTCSADCTCGDALCQVGEDASSCSADCGTCGDNICQTNEIAASCPADCGYCGDGLCFGPETPTTCGLDCQCGDNICQSSESVSSCPHDCGYCGDGFCVNGPENPTNCPADC